MNPLNVRGYIDGDSQPGDVDEHAFRVQKKGKSILSSKVVLRRKDKHFSKGKVWRGCLKSYCGEQKESAGKKVGRLTS